MGKHVTEEVNVNIDTDGAINDADNVAEALAIIQEAIDNEDIDVDVITEETQ